MEAEKILVRLARGVLGMASLLIVLCSTGCVTYLGIDGPYHGKIIDIESRQPLEGVVVVAEWYTASLTGAHTYYDTFETVTDKDGNFKIPGQGIQVLSDLDEPNLYAFKVGYESLLHIWCGKHPWCEKSFPLAWEGDRMVVGLKKLTMEERKRNSVDMPSGPKKKYKLLIRESNKEMIEIGRPKNNILPEE